MDYEKPNWRPTRKTKDNYVRRVAQSTMPSTLSVASVDSTNVVARGESFANGVSYSLNKSRRWELDEDEFMPASEASKKHKKSTKVVVARADHTESHTVKASARAFYDREENTPAEKDVSGQTKSKHSSRKDRKHFRTPKASTPNTRLPNTHQASVYAAGSADVHVAILEMPEITKVHKFAVPKDYVDHTARTHKNQALTRLAL